MDELPVFGMVGQMMVPQGVDDGIAPEDTPAVHMAEPFVYTHKDFSISYNSDRIIHINLTSKNPT